MNSTGEWACKSIQPSGTFNGSKLDTNAIDCGIYAVPWLMNSYNTIVSPKKYSFACKNMIFSNGDYKVTFESLQVRDIIYLLWFMIFVFIVSSQLF